MDVVWERYAGYLNLQVPLFVGGKKRYCIFSFEELTELWFGWLDGKHPGCDHSYFGRREFSFTLDNDIYLRFQSFSGLSEMENSIREKCPFKIDIGPVYSVDVRFLCFGPVLLVKMSICLHSGYV